MAENPKAQAQSTPTGINVSTLQNLNIANSASDPLGFLFGESVPSAIEISIVKRDDAMPKRSELFDFLAETLVSSGVEIHAIIDNVACRFTRTSKGKLAVYAGEHNETCSASTVKALRVRDALRLTLGNLARKLESYKQGA